MRNSMPLSRYSQLLLVFIVTSIILAGKVSASEMPSVNDEDVITLSAEQLGEHYKELKGYKVHTVVWIDDYFWGDPYAQNKEEDDEYSFCITKLLTKPKPDEKQYVEVIATIDGKSSGYIWLKDTIVISEGDTAEDARKQISDTENTKIPNIASFTSAVDEAKQKAVEQAEQEENKKFLNLINLARNEFEASNKILTLTPKQLDDNHSKLEGMQFHTVLTVSSIQKDHFSAKLKKKDWLESFYCYFDWDIDLRKHINKKDVVEVIGTVKPGWLSGAEYISCKVLSIGEEAQIVLDEIIANEDDEQLEIDILLGKKPKRSKAKKDSTTQTTQTEKEPQSDKELSQETEVIPDTETESEMKPVLETEMIPVMEEEAETISVQETEAPETDTPSSTVTDMSDADNTDLPVSSIETETDFSEIKRGDSGDTVKEVQALLLELGYLDSSPDGKFGPRTEQAVIDLQSAAGLTNSGVIDQKTYDVLVSRQVPQKEPETEAITTTIPVLTENNTTSMYAAADVNVRSGPSADTAKLGSLTQGDKVKAGKDENGWTPIIYSSGIGYVSSKYLSSSAPLLIPVPETPVSQSDTITRNNYEQMVWIPTNGGQRFHSKSSCSRMKNPQQVTRSQAEAMGFTPCGRCHP